MTHFMTGESSYWCIFLSIERMNEANALQEIEIMAGWDQLC